MVQPGGYEFLVAPLFLTLLFHCGFLNPNSNDLSATLI